MTNKTVAARLWEKLPPREKIASEWNKGNARFGDPSWFKPKAIGWGLTPTSWQGWLYTAAWSAAIAGPFVFFLSLGRVPESLIWAAASGGALVWDVRQILRAMNPPAEVVKEDVFYIGDDQADSTRLTTRNFDLQVRG